MNVDWLIVGKGFVSATSVDGPLIIRYTRPKERYQKSQEVYSVRAASFSQRTHGTLDTIRGTIVNTRPKINRNKRVSVSGSPPVKMKRSVLISQPVPYEVV